MKIIDISKSLLSCEVYPGDPKPEAEQISVIGPQSDCNLSVLHTCVHTGTHVDAPLHFIDGGASVEKLPLEPYIGPCTVIKVKAGIITGEYVDRFFPKNCERLLIKGDGKAFFMDSSAEGLVDLGVKLIGTDALSVGCKGNQTKPHMAFLTNGVAVLENIDLSEVEPGDYFLVAAPVKLDGMEGAPARAMLIDDHIFWSRKTNR